MKGPKRSSEAFWWALFSAGGVMAALFVPGFIVATGFVLPTGNTVEGASTLAGELARWPVKVVLLGIVALSLIHCAHRIRHTLMDLGMRGVSGPLKVICYGAALAGTVWTGLVLWT